MCDIVYWQNTGVASEGTAAIVPVGLILSLIVVCILGFTGWMGWEMVYRHRVAVAGENADRPGYGYIGAASGGLKARLAESASPWPRLSRSAIT